MSNEELRDAKRILLVAFAVIAFAVIGTIIALITVWFNPSSLAGLTVAYVLIFVSLGLVPRIAVPRLLARFNQIHLKDVNMS